MWSGFDLANDRSVAAAALCVDGHSVALSCYLVLSTCVVVGCETNGWLCCCPSAARRVSQDSNCCMRRAVFCLLSLTQAVRGGEGGIELHLMLWVAMNEDAS